MTTETQPLPPRKLLFVDDEPQILDGLRNLLRKQRKQWDMTFVGSGEAALAELATTPYDVVISDMRMPGMDGAQLLEQVRQRQPRAARLILSGYAEREALLRAAPVAHQFLSKPCDVEVLRNVIERTCQLQAVLQNDRIRALAGRVDRMPAAPKVYHELTALCATSSASMDDITALVESDPAITVKVLQLVNSAYFALREPTNSIRHSISILGLEMVRGLALTANVFAAVEQRPVHGFSAADLQRHSLLVARVARRMASDQGEADRAFTAGLLHDVGKLVLALAMPDEYGAAIKEARLSGRPIDERAQLGVTHAELGAYLLGVWGLPGTIVEAVAFHHTPRAIVAPTIDAPILVHAANALVKLPAIAGVDSGAHRGLDLEVLQALDLARRLPEWRSFVEIEERRFASGTPHGVSA